MFKEKNLGKQLMIGLLIVLFLTLFVLSGILVQAKEAVTLTLIHPWSGAEWDQFEPVVKEAETALGIKIDVRAIRSEDLLTLLPTQWPAGTAPGDVIFLTVPSLILKGAKEGHIMDVTKLVNPADFVPASVGYVTTEDGKIFAAPFCEGVKPGFWYRKSFFQKNGLKEPTNWKEFIDLLEKIKGLPGIKAAIGSGDGCGWPLSDITEHFLVAFGGPQLLNELASGNCPPETWSVVEAIFKGWLAKLIGAGYFSEPIEWTTAQTMWWKGDFGLFFMGNWLTAMVDDPSDLGIFPIPGTKGITGCIDFLTASAYTKHPEETKALLKWLATEGQKVRAKQGGTVATYRSVPLELYPPAEKMLAAKTSEMEPLFDLDDAIGGEFQTTFWDQLKLLWVKPEKVDDVLEVIYDAYLEAF